MSLQYALRKKPIIAAVKLPHDLDRALTTSSDVVFLLNADIMSLPAATERLQQAGKLVFVHLDLMAGIGKDAPGIRFLAERVGVDGVVTTRSNLISAARHHHLLTIQRIFIFDSVSIEQGIKLIRDSQPDAVEVLPGLVIPHVIHQLGPKLSVPLIAGGLLSTVKEADTALKYGVLGISTSSAALWDWQDQGFPDAN